MPDREALRQLALIAARAAADRVRAASLRERRPAAEVKGVSDYVTVVDRDAEAAAVSALRQATPEIPVLAEEGGGQVAPRLWVVDPVDGTTNLVRGFPVVGVSVGLLEDGQPVVGAVAAPHTGETWTAVQGEGAWDGEGRRLRIAEQAGSGVAATGFPFRRKDRLDVYLPVFEAALRRFEDLRRPGAASLDLAYTAAGTWDGFFELGLAIWDIAAGSLLVREAGGVVSDWDGDRAAVFTSGDIVAGSPAWHEEMLDMIATCHARSTRAAAAAPRT